MARQQVKAVMVGNSFVGKTALLTRMCDGFFDGNQTQTVCCEYHAIAVTVGDVTWNLLIWDTAGQERYAAVTRQYFRGAEIAMICYSVDSRESLKTMERWRDRVLEEAQP
jgi:small GTP-binding protein